MNVLLTGASGLLGSACRTVFEKAGHNVAALSREAAWRVAYLRLSTPLAGINVMVHAGANTNVEQCEVDPDVCYRDNFLLTEGLAAACAGQDIPLVYISSTGVYGDVQATPYREYAEVRPTTHYHRAKWLGEQAVMCASNRNLVIRTGWLFGGAFENPKNFVARRLEEAAKAAAEGVSMHSNSEQRGCPTFIGDVAERLLLLLQAGHRGVFNVVNEGDASRLEYVRAILKSSGSPVKVKPARAASFQRLAKVSANEMAVNWRAKQLGLRAMPHWRVSLAQYIHAHCNSPQTSSNGY